jgi:hypothetical protein
MAGAMSRKGHRRHAHRTVGWQQRQDWHARVLRQESGAETTTHSELLLEAARRSRSSATHRYYVSRTPGQPWQIRRYAAR